MGAGASLDECMTRAGNHNSALQITVRRQDPAAIKKAAANQSDTCHGRVVGKTTKTGQWPKDGLQSQRPRRRQIYKLTT